MGEEGVMDNCPKCKTNLVGEPIPEEHREHFGGETHFRREIGVYDRARDRLAFWRCPDCHHEWGRRP